MAKKTERDPQLRAVVERSLRQLRSSKGGFQPSRLAEFPDLYSLASQTDLSQAWHWIETVTRATGDRNRYVKAALLTTFGSASEVLDRLTQAGAELNREQRTIREWSDRGIPLLAQLLVDASYMSGSRAMHFVDCVWAVDQSSKPARLVLRIFWTGHSYLEGEVISVYLTDPDAGPEIDDFTKAGILLREIIPDWKPIDPPFGAFAICARAQLRIPPLEEIGDRLLTLRFGDQATQLVRVENLPRIDGRAVAVSTFRQGVSFWFFEVSGLQPKTDWGKIVDLELRKSGQ